MESRPEAVVVARTSALALIALVAPALADPKDDDIIGTDPGARIEDVQLRTSYLQQWGRGYQAQGEPRGQPGSEAMWILEPFAMFTIRQSADVVHELTIPVDIITAASPDAVDATTQASLRNQAIDADLRTAIRRSDVDTLTTRIALHYEEPMTSGTVGAGWRRSLADDNATISVSGNVGIDGFDHRDVHGRAHGKVSREAFNANIAFSQLLSPTTVFDAGYGVTLEYGVLAEGWNAVSVIDGPLATEVLPRSRLRHALTVRLAQHIPITHSTVKAWYRAYTDDFGIHAHSVQLDAYQYVAPWLYVRGGYRFHHQTGATFFTTGLAMPYTYDVLRTSDSDLAPLSSREWSVQLSTVRKALGSWSVSAEFLRYVRTNDLAITAVSLSLGKAL